MTTAPPLRCEIFCRVIDNYGDAAVCWRLAQQLTHEHGWQVVLWIDDVRPLQLLAPDYAESAVEVRPWPETDTQFDDSDVVIEAFACELPASRLARMAAQEPPPVWLNLEYLSAEDWVTGCHGMNSPHPKLPLVKQFFFPGFDDKTGGLLRERDYAARRAAFDAAAFRKEFALPPPLPDELTISLFSYPNPALPNLLSQWANSARPIRLLRPGSNEPAARQGKLFIHPLPFLPQARYDELLWACDLNFVRGEDSFVRAQWAAQPFVWHIYPQADGAHFKKLDAFLDRYDADAATRRFWHAWNGDGALDWVEFAQGLSAHESHAKHWATRLAAQGDLVENLVHHCLERLKRR